MPRISFSAAAAEIAGRDKVIAALMRRTGPFRLNTHPYSETWIIRSGRARITADGDDIEAGPGDILVVGPETPHKFKNIGSGRLDIICIHSSPRMIQQELEE